MLSRWRLDSDLSHRRSPLFGCFQDALPIQEADRVVIVVDVPDRPEIREVQDGILGEIGHVVNDTIRLVAVVPAYGGDPAVFDAAPHLHFARNHIVLTGSKMLVPGECWTPSRNSEESSSGRSPGSHEGA